MERLKQIRKLFIFLCTFFFFFFFFFFSFFLFFLFYFNLFYSLEKGHPSGTDYVLTRPVPLIPLFLLFSLIIQNRECKPHYCNQMVIHKLYSVSKVLTFNKVSIRIDNCLPSPSPTPQKTKPSHTSYSWQNKYSI